MDFKLSFLPGSRFKGSTMDILILNAEHIVIQPVCKKLFELDNFKECHIIFILAHDRDRQAKCDSMNKCINIGVSLHCQNKKHQFCLVFYQHSMCSKFTFVLQDNAVLSASTKDIQCGLFFHMRTKHFALAKMDNQCLPNMDKSDIISNSSLCQIWTTNYIVIKYGKMTSLPTVFAWQIWTTHGILTKTSD